MKHEKIRKKWSIRQNEMLVGEAPEMLLPRSTKIHAGKDTAYATSIGVPASFRNSRITIRNMANRESESPSHGKRPPMKKNPQAIGREGIENGCHKKGALVEPEMRLQIDQAAHDGKRLRPADRLQVVEPEFVWESLFRAAIENGNKHEQTGNSEKSEQHCPTDYALPIRPHSKQLASKIADAGTKTMARTMVEAFRLIGENKCVS